jgi:hypothetical protein
LMNFSKWAYDTGFRLNSLFLQEENSTKKTIMTYLFIYSVMRILFV